MKKLAAVVVALALLPAISYAADATDTTAVRKVVETPVLAAGGSVYEASGDVSVAQGKNAAHRAVKNEVIVPDTVINTGDKSHAVLKFEDGQVVTIQANSTFHVREYRYDAKQAEKSNIVFSMLKGGMRFITGLIGQRNKEAFRLSTPNATIGIRGTDFMAAMVNNSMYNQVVSGSIGMTNEAGTVALGAGQTAVVESASALATLISASAIPAGTFSQLLSIPVPPAPPVPPATPASPSPSSGAAGAASGAAGAAGAIGAAGMAGGALAGIVSGASKDSAAEEPATMADSTATRVSDEEESKTAPAQVSKNYFALGGKIGTLGGGLELSVGSDNVTGRLGLNSFKYNKKLNLSNVDYDLGLQLQTATALLDWYPFSGSFRATAGAVLNNNKGALTATPSGGTYTIAGNTYLASEVGSLTGEMTFNKTAPYIGIGWGNPMATGKGFGFTSDFGVMIQGKPKATLTATCGAAITNCAKLQADVAIQQTKMETDLKNFQYWHVVSIGISYAW